MHRAGIMQSLACRDREQTNDTAPTVEPTNAMTTVVMSTRWLGMTICVNSVARQRPTAVLHSEQNRLTAACLPPAPPTRTGRRQASR